MKEAKLTRTRLAYLFGPSLMEVPNKAAVHFGTPRVPSEDDETTNWFHLGESADWIIRKKY